MKAENKKPRVLICGRNGSSNLCMARSFGKEGYPVEVLRIFQKKPKKLNLMQYQKPEAYSKYVQQYHSCICDAQNRIIAEKLLELATPGEKTLLIPNCDMAASAADEFMDLLREHYWIPNVEDTPGRINHLMNKAVQKKLAEESGLPVINSCVIRTSGGEFTIPDSVAYPCFIKPNVSKNSSKSAMCRCDNREELQGALSRLARNGDVEMLVEDFVEIAREYAVLGVSAGADVTIPGFFSIEEGGHGGSRGVTMVGMLRPVRQQEKLIGDIARFVGTLNYEGLFDVDLIETVDGRWYFVELNLRYGASGYAVTRSGVNLPVMYADYRINGTPLDTGCTVTDTGNLFVSEKVMMDEYARDFMPLSRVRKLMRQTRIHFIEDPEDPRPYRHFRLFYLFGMATRVMFRLRKMRNR